MDDSVRHFGSARPFGEFAKKYRDNGWTNPIYLPPKEKGPPPDGLTGHRAREVDLQDLRSWVEIYANHNIGVRLHRVKFDEWADELIRDQTFEIVGIDIDEHPEEDKTGWSQYVALAKELGELPLTWTSSARTNGKAGIRFFLAPPKLSWRGDCGKQGPDIDIICRTYRFAVVFPSFHPKGGQYYWYQPGFDPDGKNHSPELPKPENLSLLPPKWVHFLTQGYTPYVAGPMDMDSSESELKDWARAIFAESGLMCDHMDKIITKRLAELEDSGTSHPILTKTHYELLCLGSVDGHTGWGTALKQFNRAWRLDVLGRAKRSVTQANSEIDRSVTGALRKIKGKFDEKATAGEAFFKDYDPCRGIVSGHDTNFPKTKARDPNDYPLNDDGNAWHFLDLHKSLLLYVANGRTGWLIWRENRWAYDDLDFVKTLFRRVKERLEAYAKKLWADHESAPKGKKDELRKLAEKWERWSLDCGNYPRIEKAVKAAQAVNEAIIKNFNDLDANMRALGIENGVLIVEPKTGEIRIIDNSPELMITKNVGLPYIPLREQERNPKYRRGFLAFIEYVNTWIAPYVPIEYFQKLCGSTLLGDTTEKLAIFLYGPTNSGKSTWLDLWGSSLGDYACVRNPDIFKSFHLNPALATALTSRVMAVHELGDNEINSPHFKTLTGGDVVPVELKNSNKIVSAKPQFTVVIDTNSVPRVPGEDTAFRERLRIIPFRHEATPLELSRSGKERQRELLEYGRIACFAWLVEGCARYVREGLGEVPNEIRLATEDFVTQLSDLGEFAKECIAKEDGNFVTVADVYSCYEGYCLSNNMRIELTSNRMTRRLTELGFMRKKIRVKNEDGTSEPKMCFVNIRLIRPKQIRV